MPSCTRKWARELDYRLIKELWAFAGNRIAVRFAYEWHDDSGQWFRSYGNENWEFNADGYMQRRFASINDLPIREAERKFHWPLGRRPDDHPSLERARAVGAQRRRRFERGGLLGELADRQPVAVLHQCIRRHPRSAHAQHIGQRQVLGGIVQMDAAGGTEAHVRKHRMHARSMPVPPACWAGNSLQ